MGRKTYDPNNGRRRPGGWQHDFGQLLAELHAQRQPTRPARTPQTPRGKRGRTEENR